MVEALKPRSSPSLERLSTTMRSTVSGVLWLCALTSSLDGVIAGVHAPSLLLDRNAHLRLRPRVDNSKHCQALQYTNPLGLLFDRQVSACIDGTSPCPNNPTSCCVTGGSCCLNPSTGTPQLTVNDFLWLTECSFEVVSMHAAARR